VANYVFGTRRVPAVIAINLELRHTACAGYFSARERSRFKANRFFTAFSMRAKTYVADTNSKFLSLFIFRTIPIDADLIIPKRGSGEKLFLSGDAQMGKR
jgi:hypothetical protein